MTDTITLERAELAQFIRNTASQAVNETLAELGIKRRLYAPWISENEASKMVGRKRLQTAIKKGIVQSKIEPGKTTHCKFVLRTDVQKLLNNPLK